HFRTDDMKPSSRRSGGARLWHRPPPKATKVETDDDDFVTVDRWPREVFRPHFHDADFNWLVPLRAGRVVVSVEGEEIAFDGDHWICIFPRTPHAVVHVSDDGEVLSLFVHESAIAKEGVERSENRQALHRRRGGDRRARPRARVGGGA